MTGTTWAALRDLLVLHYDELCRRLTRRLGSEQLARESLHETFLQVSRSGEIETVRRPESYLFGIALNMAAALRRSEVRQATSAEIASAIEFADEAARPAEAVEAILDLEALEAAIDELPPRRRAIFLAARVQELPIQAIADALSLSRRTIEVELKRALEHCADRLGRKVTQRFGPRRPDATRE
jgi:RNA polymerase sigma factor (sigma-70 family)